MSSGYPEILAWRRFSPCIGWESMVSYFHLQDSYIGSTSASQAEEAGSITSILPPQDGRDAQHRSFWHSQKKMRRDTEAAQLPEYSRICRAEHGNENFICRIRTSVVHRLPKPRRRVRLPYPAPKKKSHPNGWLFFLESGSRSAPCRSRFFDRYSPESVVIYLCCEEGGETP